MYIFTSSFLCSSADISGWAAVGLYAGGGSEIGCITAGCEDSGFIWEVLYCGKVPADVFWKKYRYSYQFGSK